MSTKTRGSNASKLSLSRPEHSGEKSGVERKFRTPSHGGGRLQVGNPGKRPNQWRAFCAWLTQLPDLQEKIVEEMRKHPMENQGMLMFLAEQGHGRARQQVELSGEGGGPINLAAVRESLARKILGPG